MIANGEPNIGNQIEQALDDINALIPKASEAELSQLEEKRAQLLAESRRLSQADMQKQRLRYENATAALQGASATIKNAIQGMENVSRAIQMMGHALELVAQLKP